MKIEAIIHEEDGGYWAEVPAFPGCVTEGDTEEELLTNLREAIEGWLEAQSSMRLRNSEVKGQRRLVTV